MSELTSALVLHLVGGTQPLHIALHADEASSINERLPGLMSSGAPIAVRMADGGAFAVNFAHVATAHVERSRSDAYAYGALSRGTGFGQ